MGGTGAARLTSSSLMETEASAGVGVPRAPQERSTRQKRALAAALQGAGGFRSARELHDELRSSGEEVGLTTVYNHLRGLAEAGEVDVLRNDDGETLYRRCGTEGHHHHLLCRSCGRTVEVEEPQLERWADRVADAHGFVEVAHTLEIVGTCPSCAVRPAG